MPEDAPTAKMQATKGYGGRVILYNRYTQDREEIGQKLAQEEGLTLIPPYDHPHVIAGQGTAAKELFEEVGELDMLFVPLGAVVYFQVHYYQPKPFRHIVEFLVLSL